jgi:hypothetical protein
MSIVNATGFAMTNVNLSKDVTTGVVFTAAAP